MVAWLVAWLNWKELPWTHPGSCLAHGVNLQLQYFCTWSFLKVLQEISVLWAVLWKSVSFSFYIDETYVSTLVVKIYQIIVRKNILCLI